MEDGTLFLTGAGLTALIVEAIKFAWRRWVVKNSSYDFPVIFYAIAVPLLNALAPFALVALGMGSDDPVLVMTWVGVVQYVLQVVLGSLISVFIYGNTIKPTKDYANNLTWAAKLSKEISAMEEAAESSRAFNHNP